MPPMHQSIYPQTENDALRLRIAGRTPNILDLLDARGWSSLDEESRQFLAWMAHFYGREWGLAELEEMWSQLRISEIFSLWKAHDYPNRKELLARLGGNAIADLIRRIRWGDLREAYRKATVDRLKGIFTQPEPLECLATQSLLPSSKHGLKDQPPLRESRANFGEFGRSYNA